MTKIHFVQCSKINYYDNVLQWELGGMVHTHDLLLQTWGHPSDTVTWQKNIFFPSRGMVLIPHTPGMWQSLLTMTLRDVLHRLQLVLCTLVIVPWHLNILGSNHNTAHDNHYFVQYLHWALQPPTGYRATTRKQAHRASNAFSVKTMIHGWHQGWQRKTYCFCHLRNLHIWSKKKN